MKLNADLSLRATLNTHERHWEQSPSKGVQRLRLECDDDHPPVERVTTIVRFAEKSSFSGHVHTGGEEFLVLDGVFSDQHADYPAGYYVRNPPGTGHAPHSDKGCTILVKLWQMHPDDQQQIAINTTDERLWSTDKSGIATLALFKADYESVCMLRYPAKLTLTNQPFTDGVEYFVLEGHMRDGDGDYREGSWLRLPANTVQDLSIVEDTLLIRKTGHLRQPITYT